MFRDLALSVSFLSLVIPANGLVINSPSSKDTGFHSFANLTSSISTTDTPTTTSHSSWQDKTYPASSLAPWDSTTPPTTTSSHSSLQGSAPTTTPVKTWDSAETWPTTGLPSSTTAIPSSWQDKTYPSTDVGLWSSTETSKTVNETTLRGTTASTSASLSAVSSTTQSKSSLPPLLSTTSSDATSVSAFASQSASQPVVISFPSTRIEMGPTGSAILDHTSLPANASTVRSESGDLSSTSAPFQARPTFASPPIASANTSVYQLKPGDLSIADSTTRPLDATTADYPRPTAGSGFYNSTLGAANTAPALLFPTPLSSGKPASTQLSGIEVPVDNGNYTISAQHGNITVGQEDGNLTVAGPKGGNLTLSSPNGNIVLPANSSLLLGQGNGSRPDNTSTWHRPDPDKSHEGGGGHIIVSMPASSAQVGSSLIGDTGDTGEGLAGGSHPLNMLTLENIFSTPVLTSSAADPTPFSEPQTSKSAAPAPAPAPVTSQTSSGPTPFTGVPDTPAASTTPAPPNPPPSNPPPITHQEIPASTASHPASSDNPAPTAPPSPPATSDAGVSPSVDQAAHSLAPDLPTSQESPQPASSSAPSSPQGNSSPGAIGSAPQPSTPPAPATQAPPPPAQLTAAGQVANVAASQVVDAAASAIAAVSEAAGGVKSAAGVPPTSSETNASPALPGNVVTSAQASSAAPSASAPGQVSPAAPPASAPLATESSGALATGPIIGPMVSTPASPAPSAAVPAVNVGSQIIHAAAPATTISGHAVSLDTAGVIYVDGTPSTSVSSLPAASAADDTPVPVGATASSTNPAANIPTQGFTPAAMAGVKPVLTGGTTTGVSFQAEIATAAESVAQASGAATQQSSLAAMEIPTAKITFATQPAMPAISIGSQVVSAGAAPVTVSGHAVSFNQGGAVYVDGTPTNAIATETVAPLPSAQVTFAPSAPPAAAINVAGQTVKAGVAGQTVSGHAVSLDTSGVLYIDNAPSTVVKADGATSVPTASVSLSVVSPGAPAPASTANANVPALQFGSHTLFAGAAPITTAGHTVSLAPSGLLYVDGSPSTVITPAPTPVPSASINFDVSPASVPAVNLNGQSIYANAGPTIINGHALSLDKSGVLSVDGQATTTFVAAASGSQAAPTAQMSFSAPSASVAAIVVDGENVYANAKATTIQDHTISLGPSGVLDVDGKATTTLAAASSAATAVAAPSVSIAFSSTGSSDAATTTNPNETAAPTSSGSTEASGAPASTKVASSPSLGQATYSSTAPGLAHGAMRSLVAALAVAVVMIR